MLRSAAARALWGCLSGQIVAACGGDPRTAFERAEPPSEALVASEIAEAPGTSVIAGDVVFAGGARLGPRTFAPAPARAGAPVRVEMEASGVASGTLRISLQAPRAAGRQEVIGQTTRPKEVRPDPRDRAVEVPLIAGPVTAELVLPRPWHPRHAVIVGELLGDVARTGPRRADGRAILGVVEVAPEPTRVESPRARGVTVDGRLDEATWTSQAGIVLTASLDGEPDPDALAAPQAGTLGALHRELGTRVAFAWDEANLYAAADLPDEDLWSDYTAQDDPLYKQEAFELFVSATGSGRYLEFQVSPRGVTFDARFARYRAGEEAWDSSWSAVARAEGTVDDPRTRDRGFVVEVAIPWAELCAETDLPCPPRAGLELRINAFRLERPGRKGTKALSLSPTRAPDFHAWDNAAVLVLQ